LDLLSGKKAGLAAVHAAGLAELAAGLAEVLAAGA